MKTDQQPDSEAWRQRRADELRALQPEPWYIRPARSQVQIDDRALGSDCVAPMRVPLPLAEPPLSPRPLSDPPQTTRSIPARSATTIATAAAAADRRGKAGAIGRTSAAVAGLLFAVAAGWQARDMLAPEATPVRRAVAVAPRAVPSMIVASRRCDAPGVIDGLRASIAADVRRGGAEAAWSARVAGETEVTVVPHVTTVAGDGTRFCGATLTLTPPPTPTKSAPIVVPVTYSVGAADDARGPVFGLQGAVSSVRTLIELGRARVIVADPAPAAVTRAPVHPTLPAKISAVVKAKAVHEPNQPIVAREQTRAFIRERTRQQSETREHIVTAEQPPGRMQLPAKTRTEAPANAPVPVATPAARSAEACADLPSRAEGIICGSPPLTRLDRQFNTTLDRIQSSGDARAIDRADDGQRRFLARRDRCTSEDCIAKRYTDRLDDLAKIEARQAARQDEIARSEARLPDQRALPQCKGFEVYRPTRPCRVGR